MKKVQVAFIGAGKMAAALIVRLAGKAIMIASDKEQGRLKSLAKKYRIRIARDNQEAFNASPVVILAIKPQNFPEVLNELSNANRAVPAGRQVARTRKLVISIAAGIPISYLEKKLPGAAVIRTMPNNPALVGMGMTALAKGSRVKGQEFNMAKKIFSSVGDVVAVPEKWLDAVTGLSGSGPAFIYAVVEALIEGGIACGLPKKVATKLAIQTLKGAVETLEKSGKEPRELREMVSSPGGTTIEGLAVLEEHRMARAFKKAVQAATKKSKVLSKRWAS